MMLILLLSHRIALLFVPVYLFFIGLYIVKKSNKLENTIHNIVETTLNSYYRYYVVTAMILFFVLGLLSTYIFPLVDVLVGTTGFLAFKSGIPAFIELGFQQVVNAGLLAVLSGLLILGRLTGLMSVDQKELGEDKHLVEAVSIGVIGLFALGMAISWYTTILLALPFAVLSAIYIEELYKRVQTGSVWEFYLSIVVVAGYLAIALIILPNRRYIAAEFIITYLIIFIICYLGILLVLRLPGSIQTKSLLLITILASLVVVQSFYYTDSLTAAQSENFPYPYLSNEELDVSSFLQSLNIEGRVLSSNALVARRLMGMTGLPFYEDQFGASSLVMGTINATAIDNITLLPITQWWESPSIFKYNNSINIRNQRIPLFYSRFDSDYTQTIFKQQNTHFIVIENHYNFTTVWFENHSSLIEDIVNSYGNLIFSTNHLRVFKFDLL